MGERLLLSAQWLYSNYTVSVFFSTGQKQKQECHVKTLKLLNHLCSEKLVVSQTEVDCTKYKDQHQSPKNATVQRTKLQTLYMIIIIELLETAHLGQSMNLI